MYGKFWGDHVDGKLTRILNLIAEDNPDTMIKVLPLLEQGEYGSPQLLLKEKPSMECLNKIKEHYRVRIFQTDDLEDYYKYLMSIETLRFAFEEGSHFAHDSLSKHVTGNKWDFDGYFYITDSLSSYRKIAIIPYAMHAHQFDGGHNLSKDEALAIVKGIVKRLNDNTLIQKSDSL